MMRMGWDRYNWHKDNNHGDGDNFLSLCRSSDLMKEDSHISTYVIICKDHKWQLKIPAIRELTRIQRQPAGSYSLHYCYIV